MTPPTTRRIAILDDYQGVATTLAHWDRLAPTFAVEVFTDHLTDEDAVVERLAGVAVVVVMRERTPMTRRVIEQLTELQLIVTTGPRNASIDLEAAAKHGITVSGTSGSGHSTAELTMGMIIAVTRHFAVEHDAVRAGRWQHRLGPGLAGRTLGVIGLGRLGSEVARLANAFKMDVIAWSRNLDATRAAEHGAVAVGKDELFARSDVVTIHVPLSDATRGLVGPDHLRSMHPGSFLVNTSRGPIVDQAALIAALTDGHLAGAGLDVYDEEPLPPGHPLRSAPNTLLLPHIGYVTSDNYARWYPEIVEDIIAWDEGRPIRVIDTP
ncbi:MAG: D-2-hydroxyacid dehydrogenase family protein [Propionibacteriales bacterium]|nr:D-2-hydroxyacid dehydrogenase family protein [Propionibacteriales bacterium]